MTNNPDTSPLPGSPGGDAFPSTQWSMVLHAGSGADTRAHSALESLCRQYWYPLYSFIRRQGQPHHEAEDCTQEFLARLLSSEGIARARPERGRFRTFLLAALQNFLIDEWRRAHAAKRGGELIHLPLEFDTAEQRFFQEPTDPSLNPDQMFDRIWAIEMMNCAVATLREEYERSGRGALFAAIAPIVVWGGSSTESHAELAMRLGMSADAFDVALHRLRRRLGERLRTGVAQTVADETEVDTEVRHLISALKDTPHFKV